MDFTQVASIALALIAVIGFTVYILQKSKPIRTEHNAQLSVDSRTADLIESATEAIAEPVNNVAKAFEHSVTSVSSTVEKTLEPIGSGLGSIFQSFAGRIKSSQDEYNVLKSQSIHLAQEIERLNNRKIDVTGVTAQLKLGLISVSHQYTSWVKKNIQSVTKKLGQDEDTEYVGLHRANYKIQVGVDIDNLRFELMPDNRIFVYGLRNAEILGIKDLCCDALIDEIRLFSKKSLISSAKAEILINDGRTHQHAENHRKQLIAEIQNNQSIEHLTAPNARFALAFLQACLSTGGFKVEESLDALQNPQKFGELCLQINRLITEQIESNNKKQLEIEDRSKQIENEILSIVAEATPKLIS